MIHCFFCGNLHYLSLLSFEDFDALSGVAFLTALCLSLTYVPSVMKTTLMLRSGAIKTMRDPHFIRYRQAPDQVSLLTGSLFWGIYFSSILVGAVIGLLAFFFLWQQTLYFAQHVLALIAGFLVITVIRLVLVNICRCSMYKAFYRKRPALANFTLLGKFGMTSSHVSLDSVYLINIRFLFSVNSRHGSALEWTNFALSAGFIFVRMIKLLLAAAACIGRINRPFLAPGVGRFGPIELDSYPTIHTKDILSHEAHRHPYIELLGVMYLMKLRFGTAFGNSAGSTWRLLFVYALFPWLHQYRTQARPELSMMTPTGPSDFDQARAHTMRLQYLSQRKLIDLGIEDTGDEIPDELEPLDEFDETTVSAEHQETADAEPEAKPGVCPFMAPSSTVNNSYVALDVSAGMPTDERVKLLENEVARLKQELDEATSKSG